MKVRFHPQAWINNQAVDVDPEGETEWEAGDIPDDMKDGTFHKADALHLESCAPLWVQQWQGPYWVEILKENEED